MSYSRMGEKICTAVMFVIVAGYTLYARLYSVGTVQDPGPGLFPLILGFFTWVLAGILLVSLCMDCKQASEDAEKPAAGGTKPCGSMWRTLLGPVQVVGSIVLYCVTADWIGHILAATIMLVWMAWIARAPRWRTAITVAAVSVLSGYLVFTRWLGVPLPKGWL